MTELPPVEPSSVEPSSVEPSSRHLSAHEPEHRPVIGAVLALAAGGLLAAAVLGLPRQGAALPEVAREAMTRSLPFWHTTEVVSAVVYGMRATDTFGETFILLAAVVSIVVITRHKEARHEYMGEARAGRQEQSEEDPGGGRTGEEHQAHEAEEEEQGQDEGKGDDDSLSPPMPDRLTPDDEAVGTPAPERAEQMSVVVRSAVRIVAPPLAVAGLYLVLQGYSPGGGFPAGAVVLGVVLLVYAAFGYRRIASVVRPSVLETFEVVGALAIVLVLSLGMWLKGSFSANWVPLAPQQTLRSGGVVQVFSLSELVEVATGLVIATFALLGMAHDWAPTEDDENENEDDDS